MRLTAEEFYQLMIPKTSEDEAGGAIGGVCVLCWTADSVGVTGETWSCHQCGASGGRFEMICAIGFAQWAHQTNKGAQS